MDKLNAMQLFVRVAERGSFSAVARERRMGQPAVSKQIAALEFALGTELIRRTSRSIALTDSGKDFYDSALRILEDLENATSRIGRAQTAPKGLIRVIAPSTFARMHLVSTLPEFFAIYPEVLVEVAAPRSPEMVMETGFDLAIHSGHLPDSPLIARKLAQTRVVLVATAEFLARHGSPEAVDQLEQFQGVALVERGSVQPWCFGASTDLKRISPKGAFRTNDLEQLRAAVLQHLGIAQAPAWLFAAELREGTVLRLLPLLESRVPILAVRPATHRPSTKVRVFLDYLEKAFAREKGWE